MAYEFDLFVIVAGSGGVRAARFAAGGANLFRILLDAGDGVVAPILRANVEGGGQTAATATTKMELRSLVHDMSRDTQPVVAKGGDVLIGEVSTVNDDLTDNIFEQPIGRFSDIDDDVAPVHLLVSDYDKWLA